jgi:hypothetical protein
MGPHLGVVVQKPRAVHRHVLGGGLIAVPPPPGINGNLDVVRDLVKVKFVVVQHGDHPC